ncbi:entry exclusion protein TrbK [Rhizobium sp. NLR22b]|uniref:entry exclusion protein TrbK n=1 Tax=Rhizobium sp. NLR22b TaxID=2731115 RepID=UPI001C83422A|nr:entry exclusion protein TrbK [Rhizobium sp. NLR22b]MBX5241995.1 entry exclusion protein TrbK [Rhizobium sp. NLR22b]
MNRVVLVAVLLTVAAASSAATILIVNSRTMGKPELTEEQRSAREKLFGSGSELPSVKDRQEMRPRW